MAPRELKDREHRLLELVGLRLSHLGFTPELRRQRFVRNVSAGKHLVHLSFIEHPDDFDTTVDIGLRLDSVEAQIKELRGPEGKMTIGAELGNLSVVKGQRRYRVTRDTALESVATEVASAVRGEAEPIFSKYTDMREVMDALIKEDPLALILSPLRDRRWAVTLAIASQLKDRGAFDRAIATQTQSPMKSQSPTPEVFERFRDNVRHVSGW